MLTVQGVGAVLVGLVASRVVKRYGEPGTVVLGLVVVSLGLAAVTLVDQVWQLLVAVAVLGGGLPLIFVAFSTLLQKQTPGRLMGRVSASRRGAVTTTPQALSIGVGALLVGDAGLPHDLRADDRRHARRCGLPRGRRCAATSGSPSP